MTLTHKTDLDIPKSTCMTKMKFPGQRFKKLDHEQDGGTHRQIKPKLLPRLHF